MGKPPKPQYKTFGKSQTTPMIPMTPDQFKSIHMAKTPIKEPPTPALEFTTKPKPKRNCSVQSLVYELEIIPKQK